MSTAANILIDQALELSPSERAIVAEQILLSLDQPDQKIDAVWVAETEERLNAYEKGDIEATPLSAVLGKYEKE